MIHDQQIQPGFSCPFSTKSPRAHARHVPQQQVSEIGLQLSSQFLQEEQESGSRAVVLPSLLVGT